MQGNIRRIVTGHDAEGKAIITTDGPAPNVIANPMRPGYFSTQLWTTFETPAPVGDEADPTLDVKLPLSPPPRTRHGDARGGVSSRTGILAFHGARRREGRFCTIGGRDASTFKPGALHPFMHRTESIDYGIVLEGEIHLVLDDSETLLRAGDIVVQRGTNHAWSNRSGAPCRVAFVLIDGKFDAALAARLEEKLSDPS